MKLKHSANRPILQGRRVVLVDDSIVRGTTSRKIVEMVRQAGAREVHMRISSPPTTHSCFYGIDTPEREQLLAARHNVDEMAELIGADSLAFVSIDGLYRALGQHDRDPAKPHYCDACFTGDYPIPLADQTDNSERQLSLLARKPLTTMTLIVMAGLVPAIHTFASCRQLRDRPGTNESACRRITPPVSWTAKAGHPRLFLLPAADSWVAGLRRP